MTAVADVVATRVRRQGPVPFDEVVDLALYHPEAGFYAGGGGAGRRGDFLTSAEVGPLFGAVLARALDTWWRELGAPDPFVVVEAGAGAGTLARSVLAAEPACAAALRYVLVERSAALRAMSAEALRLTPPAFALGAIAAAGKGPLVVSLPALPSIDGPVVVLANELLDNLAFGLLERRDDGWAEVRVGLEADDRTLTEVLIPAGDDLRRRADGLAPGARVGGRIPLQDEAASWLRDALDLASLLARRSPPGGATGTKPHGSAKRAPPGAGQTGRVVALDYCTTTAEAAARPWPEWLRTYAGHARGAAPLDRLGAQDVTAEVCVDQLARVRPPTAARTQAAFLVDHGIEELVAEGRRTWAERAHLGDLAAVRARSRIREADALCDPTGLGAFRVLEWNAG